MPFEMLTGEQQEAIAACCTLLEQFAQASPEMQETFLHVAPMPVLRDELKAARARSTPM